MQSSMDIAIAKNTLLSINKPILLIDTCSLMDIIRVGFRDNIHINHLIGAQEIIEKLNHHEISIVMFHIVVSESNEHQENTVLEFKNTHEKVKNQIVKFMEIAKALAISYDMNRDAIAPRVTIENTISAIVDQLIEKSIILKNHSDCFQKAATRSIGNLAPSQKGKGEIKDCLIIEHYLKLVQDLRDADFNKKIIFITSNSKDFGDISKPRSPLDDEFNTLQIQYCNNFQWALKVIQEEIDKEVENKKGAEAMTWMRQKQQERNN